MHNAPLPLEAYHQFAVALAKQAGVVMRQYFAASGAQFEVKEDTTPVSVADIAINRLVIEAVAAAYPHHAVLGEEESTQAPSPDLWVCDPIDGTVPFTRGIPTSTFNLAYVREGVPLVAVTYDPFQERVFSAIKGQGAWRNGERLDITAITPKGRQVTSVEVWCGAASIITAPQAQAELVGKVLALGQIPIYLCSFAYEAMLVANGDVNGVIFGGRKPWDTAAASLIISEAGGVVSDLRGLPQRYDRDTFGLVAARPEWHKPLLEIVSPYLPSAE